MVPFAMFCCDELPQSGIARAPREDMRCPAAMFYRDELPRSGTTRAPRAGMRCNSKLITQNSKLSLLHISEPDSPRGRLEACATMGLGTLWGRHPACPSDTLG